MNEDYKYPIDEIDSNLDNQEGEENFNDILDTLGSDPDSLQNIGDILDSDQNIIAELDDMFPDISPDPINILPDFPDGINQTFQEKGIATPRPKRDWSKLITGSINDEPFLTGAELSSNSSIRGRKPRHPQTPLG